MLIITEEQRANLSQAPLKQFKQDMFIHLTDNFPEDIEGKSKNELQTLIHEGVKQAELYQIEIANDVRRYLEFMVIYAQDFDKNSNTVWAHEALQLEKLNGTAKMDLIDELEIEMMRHTYE